LGVQYWSKAMARLFHPPLSHHRVPSQRPALPGAGLVLILLLAMLAAVWMNAPSVASLLPIPPPG
jgi:hypothetical protein